MVDGPRRALIILYRYLLFTAITIPSSRTLGHAVGRTTLDLSTPDPAPKKTTSNGAPRQHWMEYDMGIGWVLDKNGGGKPGVCDYSSASRSIIGTVLLHKVDRDKCATGSFKHVRSKHTNSVHGVDIVRDALEHAAFVNGVLVK